MARERTGSFYQNNDGNWFARVTFTGSNGKRRDIKRKAENKSEAKKLLRLLLTQIEVEGENAIDARKMTFNNLADYYAKNYLVPAVYMEGRKIAGLRDVDRAKGCLTHFRNYFGNKKLREITYGDIYTYRNERFKSRTIYKKPPKLSTMNRELAVLRRIFNIALYEGWIVKNPFNCGESLIQTSTERRERILTVEEEIKLLNACNHPQRKHLKPLLIALLDTGARKGEMLKLKWSDVDLSGRIINIRALNTKTLKSRKVALTQRLYNELSIIWESSNKDKEALVFGITNNVRKSFSSVCKIAGLKEGGLDGLTLHSLRHTAATRLVRGQLPIQMVGRILGHTQINTTYRYLTANDETLFQAASIFESASANVN